MLELKRGQGWAQRQRKTKTTALSPAALHTHFAAHGFDQMLGDGQTQAGAFAQACHAVIDLAKGAKQLLNPMQYYQNLLQTLSSNSLKAREVISHTF